MKRFGTGYKRDPHDPRDLRLGVHREELLAYGPLPDVVDYTMHVDKQRSQWSTESCTGNSSARAVHVRAGIQGIAIPFPSRLVPYAHARSIEAHNPAAPLVDEGAFLRDCYKGMAQYGLVSEERWPFETALVNSRPPWDVLMAAEDALLGAYLRIDEMGTARVDAWARALASGYPISFGCAIQDAFFGYSGGMYVPGGAEAGGHAMCCAGYRRDAAGHYAFHIVNSWQEDGDPSTRWGEDGYAWFSDDFVASERMFDSWCPTLAPTVLT